MLEMSVGRVVVKEEEVEVQSYGVNYKAGFLKEKILLGDMEEQVSRE